MKTFCIFLLFAFPAVCNPVFAQLSGTYTIGSIHNDFLTFSDAVDSLNMVGTNGNVIFLAEPGIYQGFTIRDFSHNNPSDTVFFSSSTFIARDVVINGQININNTSGLQFLYLQFEPYSQQHTSCVSVSGSTAVTFSHCRFINPYPGIFSSGEALVYMEFPYTGPLLRASVQHSVLSSDAKTICVTGPTGSVEFLNDSITGDWYSQYSNCILVFRGNVFDINSEYLNYANQAFYSNSFSSSQTLHIQGNFYNNLFYCPVWISGTNLNGNHFFSTFNSGNETMQIIGNTFDGLTSMIFCSSSTISRNRFYGECLFDADGLKINSNFFFNNLLCTQGGGYQIMHNNFLPDVTLEMDYTGGVVENNNIGNMFILQPPSTTISNNNFIPHQGGSVNVYGTNPRFYDPRYISALNPHATNAALIRKSLRWSNLMYKYDIDSTVRKTIPTIGANEICFGFQSDTIVLECDSLCLLSCIQDFTGYYWSPSGLFADSTSPAPVIHPGSSCMVKLNKTGTGVIDSVYLKVHISQPLATGTVYASGTLVRFTDMSVCADSILWDFGDGTYSRSSVISHIFPHFGFIIPKLFAYNALGTDSMSFPLILNCLMAQVLSCGDSIQINSCIDDFTGFYWTPSRLFSDSTEAKPLLFPDSSVTVILRHINSDAYAFINLFVYPGLPSVSASYTINGLEVSFDNTSRCADSVYWDFGDSTFSAAPNPVHLYTRPGKYTAALYGFSLMGSDTAFIPITLTGIDSPETTQFSVSPNPVNDNLFLLTADEFSEFSLSLSDAYGRNLLELTSLRGPQTIPVGRFSPGIYFLRLRSAKLIVTKTVIIR